MTAHLHTTVTPGCFRCELGEDELLSQQIDMRVEARGLRNMADDFNEVDMADAAFLCVEKAESLERESRP